MLDVSIEDLLGRSLRFNNQQLKGLMPWIKTWWSDILHNIQNIEYSIWQYIVLLFSKIKKLDCYFCNSVSPGIVFIIILIIFLDGFFCIWSVDVPNDSRLPVIHLCFYSNYILGSLFMQILMLKFFNGATILL